MKESTLVEKRAAVDQSFTELAQEKSRLEARIQEITAEQYRLQGKYATLTELIDEIDSKKEKK